MLQIAIAKPQVTTDGMGIIITSTTGGYSPANLGGFGAPNITAAQIATATVDITIPNSTTYQLSDPATVVTIDLFALGFPVNPSVIITNVAMGLSSTDKFPDGWYNADVTVATSVASPPVVTSTTDEDFVIKSNGRCCIDGYIESKIVDCDCSKATAVQMKIWKADAALNVIDYLVDCNKLAQAANNVAFANQMCSELEACGGGCGCH